MKCRYKDCKFNGEVDKEDAIKIGSGYFHKECADEKNNKVECEKFWLENFKPTTLVVLRKMINDITKLYGADYLLYVMKWIKANNKTINYPAGLKGYCNSDLRDKWKSIKINEEYKKIKNEKIETSDEVVKFIYKPSKKKFTDII